MIGIVVRFIVGLVLGLSVLPASAWVAERAIRSVPGPWPEDPIACAIGAGLGLLVVVFWRPNWLIHTFIHEAAHALTCLALGVRIHSFKATNGKGGAVEYSATDPCRGTLIAIAPYTLPMVLGPIVLAQHVAGDGSWRPWLSGLAAWAVIDHLHGLWHNLRLNLIARDGDLAVCGRLLGLVLIAISLCLIAAAVAAVLWQSRRVFPGWWF